MSFPALDLFTTLVMTAIATVTMALCMAAMSAGRRLEGMRPWGAGLLLLALAYGLAALRGRIPDALSIVLANGVVSSVYACVLAAIHRFQGRSLPWGRLAVPVVAALALFALWRDDYVARLVLAGTLFPLQLALVVRALYRPGHPPAGRGAWLVAAGAALQAVVLMARAALALASLLPPEGLMQDGSMAQHLTFLSTFVSVQMASLGFVFMSRDRADEHNRRLAALDPLTGLPNRRSSIAALDRDIARSIRTREPLALLIVDIDHFKSINDRFGHLAGDEVLRAVARLMSARVRSQDMVGRYGGEEFIVLLPDTAPRGARELADQLCQAIAQMPVEVGGQPLAVTASIGVFGGCLEPGDSWDTVIAAADRAMYEAKRAGRNRVATAQALPQPAAEGGLRDNPETAPPDPLL